MQWGSHGALTGSKGLIEVFTVEFEITAEAGYFSPDPPQARAAVRTPTFSHFSDLNLRLNLVI